MEVVEIRSGIVTLYEQNIIKQVGVEAFKERLATTQGQRTPILPRGTVHYAAKNSRSCFFIEQEPAIRTIKYDNQKESVRSYNLPIPWTYFLLVFENAALEHFCVYFSKKRISHVEDVLCRAPFTNMHDNGEVCLGDYTITVTLRIPERAIDAINYFWKSTFNTDLSIEHDTFMPEQIKKITQEDEDYFAGWERIPFQEICLLDWKPYKKVREIIDFSIP